MMTLGVKRRVTGAKDSHGNPVESFADPTDWAVRGIAPGRAVEGDEATRDQSTIAWTIYADPSSNAPTEYDRVLVDGIEYPVHSRPADWTRGPWVDPAAGIVIELKRVEG